MLNPQSPVPLYHQLADILTAGIRSGEFQPGSKIPPEIGLAKKFGIGRPTARQAIDILVRKGMVDRRRGSGTYVREPGQEVDLFSLAGTSSAFLRQGVPIETRILKSIGLQTMPDDVDNPFSRSRAYFFSRLTLAKSDPVLIEDICLSQDLFPGIDALDLAGKSLARLVSERYYMTPSGGRQTFRIATLPAVRARILGLGDKDPILNVKRFIHFPQAENAIYSEFFCRTDRFVFSQTLGGSTHD
ncbi:MAG: GntR family transcriptional regulator [Pseudomonadota bacterium]